MLHAHAQLNHISPYMPYRFQYFSNLIMAYKFNNMRFLPLIMSYDFIQVLNSPRTFYTKN
jgi:hypothetical protein